MAAADYAVVVQQLYVAYFGRPADTKGLTDFQNLLNATGVKADIASLEAAYRTSTAVRNAVDAFGNSPESAALYGSGDNTAFVKSIYANVLNRTPADADAGLKFWVDALTAGAVSKGNIALSIMAAAKVNTSEQGKIDALTVDKKIAVASNFTVAITTLNATFSGDAATLAARALLAKVTNTTDATAFQTEVESTLQSLTPGQTFTLTTGADEKVGTAFGDFIDATVSSLSSENQLNGTDKIDGGTGYDVLRADLKSNFTGFTADKGYMKNVEKAELTNTTGVGRSFDATGTTGLKDFVLNTKGGAISLANVQDATGHITLNEQAEGSLSVGYTTKAVEGTADTLSLNLNKVGTAAVKNEAGVTTTAAKYVSVTTTGLEKVAIDSQSGANYVNLSTATGSTSVTVKGAGTTDIQAVASTVTSFDASAAKGAVTADLSGSGTLTAVKGGEGNDKITVDVTKLAANATISGGAGSNTLAIGGAAATLQPTMSGFQTLEVATALTGALTLSGKNITDLDTISLKAVNAINGQTVSLVNLGASTLNVKTTGAQAGGTLSNTSASALVYTTAASATATAAQSKEDVALTITSNESTSATINVGAYTAVAGQVDAGKATDVTLNIASGKDKSTTPVEVTAFTGTINAAKAANVVVDAQGNLGGTINAAEATYVKVTTASDANTLTLNTAKASNVEITAAKGLDLSNAATDLTGAEKVTVKANGGHVTLGIEALSKVNSLTVAGAGTTSQFTVGALGSATQDYSLSVTASGLKNGLSVGAVSTKASDISINVAGVTGNASFGAISAAAAAAGGNVTIDATGMTGSLTAGAITAGEGKTVSVNASGILGKNGNNNALELGAINASKGTIAINVKDTLNAVATGALAAKTVTIEADGSTKGLTVTTGITAEAVTVKAASSLDTVNVNTISASNSVAYVGTETKANTVTIVATDNTATTKDTLAVTVTGGILNDTVSLKSNGVAGDIVNATIDLGVGTTDTVKLVGAANGFLSEALVLKNVEVLEIDDATGSITVNASALSGQTFAFGGKAGNEALTLKGTDAADTVDLSKLKAGANAALLNIDGGKGNDIITLSVNADTLVFGGTAATNGADKITGFTTAAAVTADQALAQPVGILGDKLSFKAAAANFNLGDGNGTIVSVVAAGAANAKGVAATELVINTTKYADLASVTTAVLDAQTGAVTAGKGVLLVVGAGNDTLVYVDTNGSTAGGHTLVATLVGVDVANVAAADFAFVA